MLILCHPDDAPALWLGHTLIDLGLRGIDVVTVEQLVFSRQIVHRLSDAGQSSSVRLADGRTLRSGTIGGLINRIRYVPTQHFARADSQERAYATAELSAFLLAWVNGIAGRVINPARPAALDGGTFDRAALHHFAAMAGLPAAPWSATTTARDDEAPTFFPTHTIILLDHRVFGPLLPRDLQDGCRRLATLLGVPLLQVALHHSHQAGWRFVDATGTVDFRHGGHALAGAIAAAVAA
jgi:hypothetical protein